MCTYPWLMAIVLCLVIGNTLAATHDELPQCGLSGVYKTRQSILETPNYPNNYPTNTCWDYVVRSPYRCPTKFHIQFLDFMLESSANCSNDYLAIGLENDGDDMDVLCGQVIGIKKYHTPDGILRLRFYADDSPWTTARGFKLLITRLACERDDMLRDNLADNDEDTVHVNAPNPELQPPLQALPQLFHNLTQDEQHRPWPTTPLFGWNLPGHLPLPPAPSYNGYGYYLPVQQQVYNGDSGNGVERQQPCLTPAQLHNSKNKHYPLYSSDAEAYLRSNKEQQHQTHQQQEPLTPDQYVSAWGSTQTHTTSPTESPPPFLLRSNTGAESRQQLPGLQVPQLPTVQLQQCCTSSFRQQRFYLSSPGFPRTAFTSLLPTLQRDCHFNLEKHADNVCRLRIEFKFFDFGQAYVGTGAVSGNINIAISNSKDVCTEDFLEINNERFCGCRTGFVYTALWGLGPKQLRLRMGYAGLPSSGFLLEIYQEECRQTAFVAPQQPQQPVQQTTIPVPGQLVGTGAQFGPTTLPGLGSSQPNGLIYPIQQQQLPNYQQQSFYSGAQLPQYVGNRRFPATNQPFLPLPHQLPPYSINQFGLPMPQFRQARTSSLDASAASTHQPISVVETNSTRKEYYYFDGDEGLARARTDDEPNDPDRIGELPTATVRDRCSFSAMDALHLTVDSLWITKPLCFAPLRTWFSNMFG